jgi:protein arginine N-methyltransferase 2
MSNLYLSSSLVFYSDKIICEDVGSPLYGTEVMMNWEDSLMSASAEYVTQNSGDVLEIGFGMGIASGYIQSHSISSHTIVENHPQIILKAIEWAIGKSNVTIISQSWYDVKDSLGTFDGIFYDTYGDNDMNQFSSSLSGLTKSGTKVTFWNNNQSETNYYNIPNVTYKSISITPDANSYFTGSTTYYMPMREF